MDIMLGKWAETKLSKLDERQLQQFDQILEMENPDLYKWFTGQQAVPDEVDNPLLRTLCADLKGSMASKLSVPSTTEFKGAVWE